MCEKLQEGQKLWWVGSSRRDEICKYVTVTKVGRKWAQLDNFHRIDIETLKADGGDYISPGRCYLSKEIYEAGEYLQKEWTKFSRETQGLAPKGVTILDIQEARKLLRIPSTE